MTHGQDGDGGHPVDAVLAQRQQLAQRWPRAGSSDLRAVVMNTKAPAPTPPLNGD